MDNALSSGKNFELFMHNIKAAGHNDIIIPFKGWSNELLPLLGNEKFDLVFIDGSHTYASVLKDINNSVSLVTEGGIICGDDLELQLSQLDVEHAKKHTKMDYIIDPKTKIYYHPGVSLAVAEFFGEVSVWKGFWAIRKKEKNWEKVELSNKFPEHITIPEHLEKQRASNYLRFGEELYTTGRVVETGKTFLKARTLAPNSAEANKALAVIYRKLGNFSKAAEFAQRVSQLCPDDSNVAVKIWQNDSGFPQ